MTRFLFVLFVGLALTSWSRAQAPPPRGGIVEVQAAVKQAGDRAKLLFSRGNLVAWCIVPFDSRKRAPEERATMLEKLGFRKFAYDWRSEHIPTFDAEIDALERHHIELVAFWVPSGDLTPETKLILDVLKRYKLRTQLWVLLDMGADRVAGREQERRVETAAKRLEPLAEEARKIGCTVGLYNHGGWFGEPENQIAIIDRLKAKGVTNLGIVYNLHHGHDQIDRFPKLLAEMKPYLLAINLNGMDRPDEKKKGEMILPLGQGTLDLTYLRTIRDSGYLGPIGILGHTEDDAEERLRDNLDGLDWLVPQLDGKPAGPEPKPRTYRTKVKKEEVHKPSNDLLNKTNESLGKADLKLISELAAEAKTKGDSERGAGVFASLKYGCLTCHRVGHQGGTVGPELTMVGKCLSPEKIVEAVLWPSREVKEGYRAVAVATESGKQLQGYKQSESDAQIVLKDAGTNALVSIPKVEIAEIRDQGTLMPAGLAAAMSEAERLDLFRFLIELDDAHKPTLGVLMEHPHGPASFVFDKKPIDPSLWPNSTHPVNRDRLYDFYTKEAEHFLKQASVPPLLPQFPGLDGGTLGHWGNQNDDVWIDDRWNKTDLGTLLCGIFRGGSTTVPKGVCVRLGDRGEFSVCFNPETLQYEALWEGGFVKFSPRRHGFLDGLIMDGKLLPKPEGHKPKDSFIYHGFYRYENRVVFSYRIGDVEMLDSPWVEAGKFKRMVAPATEHPFASWTKGGLAQWPQVLATRASLGGSSPYSIDTIEPPFHNPWNALLFFGGHDFSPDGTAFLCTMQGDVWRVQGLDEKLEHVRWRRIASGLSHLQGLVVVDGHIYVLGRDQITRLVDLNDDGEIDFYECVNNAYITSTSGHDFICGLERGPSGDFYTVSGKQGLLRVPAGNKPVEVIASGFRNPDGLALLPDGTITLPSSEGEWTPASMVCEIKKGGYYGYGGPRNGAPPDLPLVYLPRGLDNSSGAQVFVSSKRWGPLEGLMVHFSYGAGTQFLLLREKVGGQPQGAVVPLTGDFRSGVHRGRFNPQDGQLYVTGMGGWGTYTSDDGCFQRVRYTGAPARLPVDYHVHENGIVISMSDPVERGIAQRASNHFAQVWNYRYSAGYGSPELSTRHPGAAGHDPLTIRSATVLDDGRSIFFEMPDLQPVNQIQMHIKVDAGPAIDIFGTVHKLAAPFTQISGYKPVPKVIGVHPILADLSIATKRVPNPWRSPIAGARPIALEAGGNLTFSTASIKVRPGELIKLTFANPDVVPHNWALIKPGTLAKVGDLANKIISDPDAAARHYIPKTDDVLVYTDIVDPKDQFSICFRAPAEKGRYPYLCTFPGHWMVMNGTLIVE